MTLVNGFGRALSARTSGAGLHNEMARKESGRPAGGDPIPNDVRQDNSEFTSQPLDLQQLLQVSRLTRRCAISAAMAATMAPMIFGEGVRG